MIIDNFVVDILMTTYNGEKYLREQLDSILTQDYPNFRLIIADDRSTDMTPMILEEYAKHDSRIQLIKNTRNLGVIKNFEQLLYLSTASYFMFCDQDDVWATEKISLSLSRLIKTGAMMVYSDLTITDDKMNVRHHSYMQRHRIQAIKEISWKALLVQNIVTGCTIMGRSELKKYALPFPKGIAMHDAWLALAASANGRVGYIEQPLVLYRQHNDNLVGAANSFERLVRREMTYNDFLIGRTRHFEEAITILEGYADALKQRKDVLEGIQFLISCYKTFSLIKRVRFNLLVFRQKRMFPSQGLMRNIWWICYSQFPSIAYYLIRLLKLKDGAKQNEG